MWKIVQYSKTSRRARFFERYTRLDAIWVKFLLKTFDVQFYVGSVLCVCARENLFFFFVVLSKPILISSFFFVWEKRSNRLCCMVVEKRKDIFVLMHFRINYENRLERNFVQVGIRREKRREGKMFCNQNITKHIREQRIDYRFGNLNRKLISSKWIGILFLFFLHSHWRKNVNIWRIKN